MWEEILKAIPIIFSTALKFIFGPLGGYAVKLHIVTTIISTILGMMLSVVTFTYFGEWLRMQLIRYWIGKRKKFTPGNRRIVGVWKKYGLAGVAVLTPLLLTPIGGTLIAVSLGSPKEKIILYMFISASFFAVVFSLIIYFFGAKMLPDFVR